MAASVRPWRGATDIDRWLALRNRAFAAQTAPARAWEAADFHREFPGPNAPAIWFAELPDTAHPAGAIALRFRPAQGALIHWLAVDPDYRRRGIGRLLVRHAEQSALAAGCHHIEAETLARWTAAVGLYRSLGYTAR